MTILKAAGVLRKSPEEGPASSGAGGGDGMGGGSGDRASQRKADEFRLSALPPFTRCALGPKPKPETKTNWNIRENRKRKKEETEEMEKRLWVFYLN